MAHIEWLDSYTCNIELLDGQHQKILSLINRLDDLVASKDRDAIGQVLNELVSVIIDHFEFEEELLGQTGYGHLKAHKKLHDRFVTKLFAYTQQYDTGECIIDAIHPFLEKWFVHHMEEDKDFCADVAAEMNEAQKKKKGWFSRTFG
ncbi:MAG: bacteriohemerythrin [Pseudomonadota bacterium]